MFHLDITPTRDVFASCLLGLGLSGSGFIDWNGLRSIHHHDLLSMGVLSGQSAAVHPILSQLSKVWNVVLRTSMIDGTFTGCDTASL